MVTKGKSSKNKWKEFSLNFPRLTQSFKCLIFLISSLLFDQQSHTQKKENTDYSWHLILRQILLKCLWVFFSSMVQCICSIHAVFFENLVFQIYLHVYASHICIYYCLFILLYWVLFLHEIKVVILCFLSSVVELPVKPNAIRFNPIHTESSINVPLRQVCAGTNIIIH